MWQRPESPLGPDFEPYLQTLDRRIGSVRMLLVVSVLLLLSFGALSFYFRTMYLYLLSTLALLFTLFSLWTFASYRLIAGPARHRIEKRFRAKGLEKLSRTTLRKWADKNSLLVKKEAGAFYYYFWYAYPYAPVYYVMRLDANEGILCVYYLWPDQHLVAAPDHPNISSPAGLFRLRKRELQRDAGTLGELEEILN